jgi:signal transduction histidine kinase
LINLVGNAIKYCHPGDKVAVGAQCEEQQLVVTIADTGPGIPDEELEHIFERFYRVSATEDEASGAGLGLAITQQIIKAHNGEIAVSSAEGEGTTFTFTLPIEAQ